MLTLIVVSEKCAGIWQKILNCCLLTFFCLTICAVPACPAYEEPPVLQAKSILQPEFLKGKNHSVQDKAINDGLFNHYTVETNFGTFKAGSTDDLKILVNEINAIVAMQQVETDDTMIEGLKQSGHKTISGVENLFSDPQSTLEGAASGVGSLLIGPKKLSAKGRPPMQKTASLNSWSVSLKQRGRLLPSTGLMCIPGTQYCRKNSIAWAKLITWAALELG